MKLRRRFAGAARAGERLCAPRRMIAGSLTARVKEEARDNGLPPFSRLIFI